MSLKYFFNFLLPKTRPEKICRRPASASLPAACPAANARDILLHAPRDLLIP